MQIFTPYFLPAMTARRRYLMAFATISCREGRPGILTAIWGKGTIISMEQFSSLAMTRAL